MSVRQTARCLVGIDAYLDCQVLCALNSWNSMRQVCTSSLGAFMTFAAVIGLCTSLGAPAFARILLEDIKISPRRANHCHCANLANDYLRTRCLTAYTIDNKTSCRVVYSPDLDEARARRREMLKDRQMKIRWAKRCCSNNSYTGYEDWVSKTYVIQCEGRNICIDE
jgi:hypothetical protein